MKREDEDLRERVVTRDHEALDCNNIRVVHRFFFSFQFGKKTFREEYQTEDKMVPTTCKQAEQNRLSEIFLIENVVTFFTEHIALLNNKNKKSPISR